MLWLITDSRHLTKTPAEILDSPKEARWNHLSDEVKNSITDISHLGVYGRAYFHRLFSSMAADFPAIRTLLGQSSFERLVSSYLFYFPSTVTNIDEVGLNLPIYLKEYSLSAMLPFLADLAKLEWLLLESFYSEDSPALSLERLQNMPEKVWGRAQLRLSKHVRFLNSDFPVVEMWEKRESSLDEFKLGEITRIPRTVLIWRDFSGFSFAKDLSVVQSKVLGAISAETTLEAVFEMLHRDFPEIDATDVQAWFQEWTARGIFSAVLIDS
jgi:hypothetical protein